MNRGGDWRVSHCLISAPAGRDSKGSANWSLQWNSISWWLAPSSQEEWGGLRLAAQHKHDPVGYKWINQNTGASASTATTGMTRTTLW